jgi:hypothetical protein
MYLLYIGIILLINEILFPNYNIYKLLHEWLKTNLWYIFLDGMSIKFIVSSYNPVARYLPSAEKATLLT